MFLYPNVLYSLQHISRGAENIVRLRDLSEILSCCSFVFSSIADAWHYGVDPDPRIHASD